MSDNGTERIVEESSKKPGFFKRLWRFIRNTMILAMILVPCGYAAKLQLKLRDVYDTTDSLKNALSESYARLDSLKLIQDNELLFKDSLDDLVEKKLDEGVTNAMISIDTTQLPLPSDGILYHEIKLRSVESGLAILNDGLEAHFSSGLDDGVLSLLPILVATDVLGLVIGIPEGNLGSVLVELEYLEDIEDQFYDFLELSLELVRGHEHVGVILGKGTYPCKAVELAALLVTVNRTELCHPQGEVPVGPGR